MKTTKIFVNQLFPVKEVMPENVVRFIRLHAQASWFHLQPINGCTILQDWFYPVIFIATQKEHVLGVIVAMHIRNKSIHHLVPFSSRVQVNGSPILLPNHPNKEKVLSLLLDKTIEYASEKASLLEFRNSFGTSPELKIWLHVDFSYSDHLNLIKAITSPEQLWQELGENRRRQIKKATLTGTTVRPAETSEQIHSFYIILNNLYTTKVRKQIPPVDFFIEFFQQCQSKGKGVILLAFKDKKVIGGIVCPILERNVMYEWYVCGMDKEYPHHHPSIMVTWHALLYACENGIKQFDFMGLGKPGIPYGVRDFKLRFGGEVVNYGRHTKVFRKSVLKGIIPFLHFLFP